MKNKLLILAFAGLNAALYSQSLNLGNTKKTGAPELGELGPAPAASAMPYSENESGKRNELFYFNSAAFALNGGTGTIPVGPFTFKLNNTTKFTSFNNPTPAGEYVLGSCWALGKWFAVRYPDNNLITIDTISGARTVVGPMSPGGKVWAGMSYDETAGVMYAVSVANSGPASSTLYTVDITTGTPTQVGASAAVTLINLAANKAGKLYAVDIVADNFGTVDKTTGAFTVIGPIGFNASYAQDMEFDLSTDTCIWACYNVTAAAAELRTVDVTTGASILMGTFPASSQIIGLAIPAGHVVGIRDLKENSRISAAAFPNPFSGQTDITFSLSKTERITIELSGLCGKKITVLADETYSSGDYAIRLDASGMQPGVYFCNLHTGNSTQALKILLTQ